MNVQIDIGLSYNGSVEGLDPLIETICDALVDAGYGTEPGENGDGPVLSMLVLKERELVTDEQMRAYMTNGINMYIPMKDKESTFFEEEEENERNTGDQREAGSEDPRPHGREDRAGQLQ